jgi:signal transduction histidine kinase
MRERLRLHGGRLDLRSTPGHGTRLRAVVPLAEG